MKKRIYTFLLLTLGFCQFRFSLYKSQTVFFFIRAFCFVNCFIPEYLLWWNFFISIDPIVKLVAPCDNGTFKNVVLPNSNVNPLLSVWHQVTVQQLVLASDATAVHIHDIQCCVVFEDLFNCLIQFMEFLYIEIFIMI